MSTPTFPPPPIELQNLGNGPDAFPAPPQPSPQTSTSPNARRPNNLKGDRHRSKESLQKPKYNSGSDSGSMRATAPSPTPLSGPGPEVSAQGDSKPLPPLLDPRFTNLDNGITPAPPEPANPNLNLNATVQPVPPQKRDLAIQETGTVVELLDRPYLTPDDDVAPMRPQVGGWGGGEGGGRGGRHCHKDQLDSIGLPVGFRAPPRYGDPAAARRYSHSSSSSDTMHSSSSSGCHGQSNCVLCAPFFSLLLNAYFLTLFNSLFCSPE